MWEITLLGNANDILYFLQLKDKLNKFRNVFVAITYEDKLVFSIATDDLKNKKIIVNTIFEYILKIVKNEYYLNNLSIFGKDKSLNSFILSSLVSLNLCDEIEYSKVFSKLTKTIDIRSFVYFRLTKIVDLWNKEICYYNSYFLKNGNKSFYLEFLRFLSKHNIKKQEIIYLIQKNNDVIFLNKNQKQIKKFSNYNEIDLVLNLVLLAPKKLIINCIDSLSLKVKNLINYIFDDRLSILL